MEDRLKRPLQATLSPLMFAVLGTLVGVAVGAVGGKPVYPMDRLPDIIARNSVRVAILTVPRSAAQDACDEIVGAGITAILNFAPVYLHVPEGVTVKYEDLAVTLAALCGERAEDR